MPVNVAHAPEHFAWCGKIAEHDAVKHDDRYEMSPRASGSTWRNSFE
jgi:hypothetical protein